MKSAYIGMLAALLGVYLLWLGSPASAQSGTRQPTYTPRPAPARNAAPMRPPTGSSGRQSLPNGDRRREPVPVAFDGRCAVCLVDGKQWVSGNPQYSVVFDGHEYRFPGDAEKNAFTANPDRYVPALNGNSVVEYANSGALVSGDMRVGLFHNGRVYLFRNEEEKRQFQANPAAYAEVDLAYGGVSAVNLVDSNRRVAGVPEFATRYRSFRYLFISEQDRRRFLQDADRYAQKAPTSK